VLNHLPRHRKERGATRRTTPGIPAIHPPLRVLRCAVFKIALITGKSGPRSSGIRRGCLPGDFVDQAATSSMRRKDTGTCHALPS
jgi:hypothetical protein